MIVLFTDFGSADPYVGQMHAVLSQKAPGIPVIDLFHDVPSFNIKSAAYLLPAYTREFPVNTIFVCVVDPGVGGSRRPVIVKADGSIYVGPDNGLFHVLCKRAAKFQMLKITLQIKKLSSSFHGRDLFAPVAAMLAIGQYVPSTVTELDKDASQKWPDDLMQVIYIDHYGNAITGMRSNQFRKEMVLQVKDQRLHYVSVYSEAKDNELFWYENANGLIEIALNKGNAASQLNIEIGESVDIV